MRTKSSALATYMDSILTDPPPATIAYSSGRSVSFVILGVVESIKNGRRILKNRKTGKPFSGKSSDALRYVENFTLQVPVECRNLGLGGPKEPLRAVLTIYHVDMRSDVDGELVFDCLQKSGVVSNDRHIREKHLYGSIDAKNPRVEILLEEL